jgi:fucose 4-O-acetylase-like acetyltransferase
MVFNGAKYDSLWQLVKRRAKTLLLPYLLFSVLTWIIWVGTKIVSHEQVNLFFPLLETVFAQGSVDMLSTTFLCGSFPVNLWLKLCIIS